ncbi:MAG: MBL fold metallo-hydrolase, partial [Frankiaceae bacterium]|nr:MBL fold metallo-hydrolase [Frankiaceae bacterium]
AFPNAPLIIGRNEARLLGDADANLSRPFGLAITSPPADRLVDEGKRLELAGFTFEVREIPGHSPGSVVFVCEAWRPAFVFGGDVLFAGSIGRTDLPGGSWDQMQDSLRRVALALPDETVVRPGHGPDTTIGRERATNPFLLDLAGATPPSARGL